MPKALRYEKKGSGNYRNIGTNSEGVRLFTNAAAKRKDIKESIGVKTFFLRYYKVLLGIIKPYGGESLATFEVQDEKLLTQIKNLEAARLSLRKQFEEAPNIIPQLEREIQELEKRFGAVKYDTKVINARINKVKTLQDKLAILTEELLANNVNIDDLINELQNEDTE